MRARRKLAALTFAAAGIGATFLSVPAQASPPGNGSAQALVTVVNASGGLYWRYGPNMNDAIQRPGYGVYNGNSVALYCYAFGGPSSSGNTLWYYAEGPFPQGDGEGWINDHYLDTPGTAASPQPITQRCPGY